MTKINRRALFKEVSENEAREIVRVTAARTKTVDVRKLAREINDVFLAHAGQLVEDWSAHKNAIKTVNLVHSCAKKLERILCRSKDSVMLQKLLTAASMSFVKETGALALYGELGFAPPDPNAFWLFNPLAEPGVARIFSSVGLLERLAAIEAKSQKSKPSRSSIELLTAQKLPLIFERNFGLPFGIGSYGDSGAEGPGVRFVLACLNAGGIMRANGSPYSAETIRTYWQNRRRGVMRRKPDKSAKKN